MNEEKQGELFDKDDPAETYNPSTRIPKKRDFVLDRPGNVNYAQPGGSYPGSRIIHFVDGGFHGMEQEDEDKFGAQVAQEFGTVETARAVELLNLYFKHRANLLTTNVVPDNEGGLYVIFTNHLEGKKLAQFQRYQHIVAEQMRKAEEEDAEREEKEREEEEKKTEEAKQLIELGKKVRDQNIIEKLRKLDAEFDTQNAYVNKLKKLLKKNNIEVPE